MILWILVFFFEKDENQRYFDIVGTYPRNYRKERGPPALGGFELQRAAIEMLWGPRDFTLGRIIFLLAAIFSDACFF